MKSFTSLSNLPSRGLFRLWHLDFMSALRLPFQMELRDLYPTSLRAVFPGCKMIADPKYFACPADNFFTKVTIDDFAR